MPSSQSNPKLLLLPSNGSDEKKSSTSTAPVDIPKKKKKFNGPTNKKVVVFSSLSDNKIARKEPKQEIKSDPLITNAARVPKMGKSSPSKFPSKSSINVSNNIGTGDNQTQPNWRSGGGGGFKEGNTSRIKLNPQQQRHLNPGISQQQRHLN